MEASGFEPTALRLQGNHANLRQQPAGTKVDTLKSNFALLDFFRPTRKLKSH